MTAFRFPFVLLGTFIAVVPAIGSPGADNELDRVLARMDQASSTFKGLTADLRKVAHTEVINKDDIDEGTIAVKRMKAKDMRVLIDIQRPDPKKAMIGGAKAQIYYPKMNELQEWDLGKNRGLVDQFMLLGFGSNSKDLKDAYSITLGGPEIVAGEKSTRIELLPKTKEILAHFKKFELWISEQGMTIQQKMHQTGGDYISNTYTHIVLNPNLPDSAVKMDVPKNAKVVKPQK
jgi:outer membrane lipoprotein-sorting protein